MENRMNSNKIDVDDLLVTCLFVFVANIIGFIFMILGIVVLPSGWKDLSLAVGFFFYGAAFLLSVFYFINILYVNNKYYMKKLKTRYYKIKSFRIKRKKETYLPQIKTFIFYKTVGEYSNFVHAFRCLQGFKNNIKPDNDITNINDLSDDYLDELNKIQEL
jgi:hypothetical protein